MAITRGNKPPIQGSPLIFAGLIAVIAYGVYKSGALRMETFVALLVLIPSIVLHEISHGFLAYLFGDQTAKRAGRLSLNPIRHIDPVGSLFLPLLLLLITNGGNSFGWAKPVPVNVSQMSRNKAMLVGLVGPFTNIVIAVLAALGLHILVNHLHSVGRNTAYWLLFALVQLGAKNVILAVFNLIPIPPLDGSAVVERFLPQRYMQSYLHFRQYAMYLLLFLMLMSFSSKAPSVLSLAFDPALHLWGKLIPAVLRVQLGL